MDVFDNLVLIKETPGDALLEPLPLRRTTRPPVIPDRVDPASREATMYLTDIYAGRGLEGVPRGTVKRLRIYEQHYAYPHMGGHIHIGVDGPWDVHRILGTVPVETDGSAGFKVPANTPLAVQPLDEQGQAVQLMRSWFTAMPGEIGSCMGCHESQNAPPPTQPTGPAAQPSAIAPWYGPPRGFSFVREVQPVLDKYCVGCHDGHQTPPGTVGPTCDCWAASRAAAEERRSPVHALLPRAASVCPPSRSRERLCPPVPWNSMPAPANWCRCSKKATTTSSSTPRPGTGWSPGSI